MLNHCLVPLSDLFVVLKIDELLERPQILVQFALDLCLGVREVRLVGIIKLCQAEVRLHLVDRLLDQGTSLLAHDVEEEELEVALVRGSYGWYELLLDELADSLKIDQVSLQWRILNLKYVEKTLKTQL